MSTKFGLPTPARREGSYGGNFEDPQKLEKLKTTTTPDKNGSYGIKGGFTCHVVGSVCHIFSRNPLILSYFYAIATPIVWHILGACSRQFGGLGLQSSSPCYRGHLGPSGPKSEKQSENGFPGPRPGVKKEPNIDSFSTF